MLLKLQFANVSTMVQQASAAHWREALHWHPQRAGVIV
jgi:hypothetical protein